MLFTMLKLLNNWNCYFWLYDTSCMEAERRKWSSLAWSFKLDVHTYMYEIKRSYFRSILSSDNRILPFILLYFQNKKYCLIKNVYWTSKRNRHCSLAASYVAICGWNNKAWVFVCSLTFCTFKWDTTVSQFVKLPLGVIIHHVHCIWNYLKILF